MIRIITDTTSVLPKEFCDQNGIILMPQMIIFGEKTFRDDTELDTETFLQMLAHSPHHPKTAAPPPSFYEPYFKEFSRKGDSVIVICPSSKVSGTVRSASVAATEFPSADIRVIDTQSIAGGMANLVMIAVEMVEANKTVSEILETIESYRKKERLFFLVDTLEFLAKGGRIGNAKALVGGMLQLKPILTLKEGVTTPFENQRTHKKAMSRLIELVTREYRATQDSRLNIVHAGAIETAESLANKLKKELDLENIAIYNQCASIVTHVGPGAIAISYFDKQDVHQ